jgi:biogenesis of lysosome-related organelles complex 1 subunit 2
MASRKEDHISVVVDKKEDLPYRTTLSTSTSSFEALDPHDPQLNRLASEAFTATSDWISAELESTTEDYKLIEQMNRVTATKYSDMEQITANIAKGMSQLNVGYTQLQPYLEQIDQIDESVGRLESAAFKLDAYSKRLEDKFKSLEKRNAN